MIEFYQRGTYKNLNEELEIVDADHGVVVLILILHFFRILINSIFNFFKPFFVPHPSAPPL